MPLFGFQRRFVADIRSGRKRQTVRALRKNTPKVGQAAHLYVGLRTPDATLLGRYPITDVRPIFIDLDGTVTLAEATDPDAVYHGRQLSIEELEAFAQADGLSGGIAFTLWIEKHHGLPFQGHVTYWDPTA